MRAALGDELADALEWAAAAVKHREQVLFAMTEHAGWSAGERCAYCASELVHDIDCTVATALHALDPEWNRREVELAHEAALTMARQRSDGPRLTTIDFIDAARYATQVLMRLRRSTPPTRCCERRCCVRRGRYRCSTSTTQLA